MEVLFSLLFTVLLIAGSLWALDALDRIKRQQREITERLAALDTKLDQFLARTEPIDPVGQRPGSSAG